MIQKLTSRLRELSVQTDFPFLTMMSVLMLDKIWAKPLALIISLIWIKTIDWRAAFRKMPSFYWLILILCIIQLLFRSSMADHYLLFWTIGFSYWLLCIYFFVSVYTRAQTWSEARTNATIHSLFGLNTVVTFVQLGLAMIHSQSWNPYALWDNPNFGNSTGDLLQGMFLAPCYINFFANSLFALYFLYHKQNWSCFFAVAVLTLTSCNFAMLAFVVVFIAYGLFLRRAGTIGLVLSLLGLIVFFYLVISVGNFDYLKESLVKVEHHYDESKTDVVDHTVSRNDQITKKEDSEFFKHKKGKLISFDETIDFARSGNGNLLLGAGMGNFSSLLARRQSDIQADMKSKLFRRLPTRIAPSYRANHYTIEKHLYNLPTDWHSIQQLPSSFFNQILGEYGLVGSLMFLLGYVWFLLRRTNYKAYFFPMCVLVGYYLLFDYLFEYLSIMVLFELFYIIQLPAINHKRQINE